MQACQYNKGQLIKELMLQNGWTYDRTIFFDDTAEHLAEARQFCRTFLVASRAHGLQCKELLEIRHVLGLSDPAK